MAIGRSSASRSSCHHGEQSECNCIPLTFMLYIEDAGVDPSTAHGLRRYQSQVDAAGQLRAAGGCGQGPFKKRNKESNPVFRVVRTQLREMCAGAQRCGYCEDSVGDEVEHILPKGLYPERVFVWQNYLFACGRCNGGKSSHFAVIVHNDLVDVTRRRGMPVRRPRRGSPALINPREENPLQCLDLELTTFVFLPGEGLGEVAQKRAGYTIQLLRLNRDLLLKARRNAYGAYRARLVEYRDRKASRVAASQLEILATAITTSAHPTVWREMQPQSALIPELATLFSAVPEALTW